jgi:hypothetical protein
MGDSSRIQRREFLKTVTAGLAATSVVGFPHVARAQTRLALGLWDHWVPGANGVLKEMIEGWGKANRVDVTIDFITSVGEKLQATAAAESRAGTGHDIMAFVTWDGTKYKDRLEPLNEVADALVKKYGPFNENATYLCLQEGRWITLPSPVGSHTYPLETRMDLWKKHAGIDVVEIFPPDVKKRDKKKVDAWDWKMFLEGAKKVHAAGVPVGLSIAENTDSNDWLGPLFACYGSFPMDEKGNVTIESDATLQALDYLKELTRYMPADIYAWDDASNNRWLISGKGSAIINPPSAWTVAKRDQPAVAAQVWHHDAPRGPKGRWRGSLPFTWGVWRFSKNKAAAKDLLLHLSQKEQQSRLITASQGYDMPQMDAFLDHPIWAEIEPPRGTQYNYPIRGDERLIVAGWPARPEFAAQIYTRYPLPHLVSRVTQKGESPRDAMKWAAREIETYKRG